MLPDTTDAPLTRGHRVCTIAVHMSPAYPLSPGSRWASSSVGERLLHTQEVAGSKPASPTTQFEGRIHVKDSYSGG
jgi:hypothetical protein